KVVLNWNAPSDDHTPAAGLNYNVRIGTAPGGSNILAPHALANGTRLVPQMGNAGPGLNAFYLLPPSQAYYWSVQAVDPSLAGSPFAAEQQFVIGPLLVDPVRFEGGAFEFYFTNQSALSFDVLVSTNVALPLANWTSLGSALYLGGGLYRFTDTNAVGQP